MYRLSSSHFFSLDIKGEPIDLAACRGKHAVVVEMWATWCPPCRTSIPHLTELQKKYPQSKFVGITKEEKGAASAFVSGMGDKMDYAVACNPMGSSQRYMTAFNLNGIPSAIVIDKNGKMIYGGHPMEPAFEAALKKADSEHVAPAVDLNAETTDSLMKKSVKELKQIALASKIDISQCVEKQEIVSELKK